MGGGVWRRGRGGVGGSSHFYVVMFTMTKEWPYSWPWDLESGDRRAGSVEQSGLHR